MSGNDLKQDGQDPWAAATWEGAQRETMRRWAALPLESIIAAQEEMWDISTALGHDIKPRSVEPAEK